jgi:signal transduction histidine kinase
VQAVRLFGADLLGKNSTDLYAPQHHITPQVVKSALLNSPDGQITNINIPLRVRGGIFREMLCAFSLDKDSDAVDGLIIPGVVDLNRALDRVAESLTKSHKLEEILGLITGEALRLCNARRAYIKIHDVERNVLTFSALASKEPNEKLPEKQSEINRGMTGYVFRKRRLRRSGDVRKDPPSLYYSIFPDTVSKLVVPILFKNEVVGQNKERCYGVLCVDGTEVSQFGVETEEILSSLAKYAAIAIEQTKLIHEVQFSYQQILSEIRYARDAIGAGNLLHDGKNMVRDVIDEIEAIQKELSEVVLYKRKAKDLQKRLNGLYDLRDLMRDLLEQLRNPSAEGRLANDSEPIDLRELVRRVINIIPLGEANIEIAMEPDEKSYPVYGEPTRILLVLYNLVTNAVTAIKRSEKAGKIQIAVSNAPKRRNYRRVVVEDDGPGLTKSVLDFVRKKKEYSSVPGGSGLGLLTVRETVDDLNGTITVDSKFGSYTRFTIDLPGPTEAKS